MATTEIPAYLRECVGACVICGKEAVLGDGLCQECWDDGLKPPKVRPGDNHGNGSRNDMMLDMADSHIPHTIIAAKFGLRKSTVRNIVHQMRERRRAKCRDI